MEALVLSQPAEPLVRSGPVWRLGWLTPWRCRAILLAVLAYGFIGHLLYLWHDCPIGLSPDEAQYWTWSKQLALSYYSKGPLIAYIIRASCALFGDVMWAVRLPALILGVCTSLVTYLLTLRLFRSDRLALGAVLLNHLVPMFIAGSLLMTIDPPFYFCWALATWLLAEAVFSERRWCWLLIGVVVGTGFLAKYAMLLWLPIALSFVAFDPAARRQLRSLPPWIAVATALAFTTPVLIWNAHHHWATFAHVGTQTGATSGGFHIVNVLILISSQVGVVGPAIAVFMIAGAVLAVRRHRAASDDPSSRRLIFLLWIGFSFFLIVLFDSFRAKVQVNWPAPAYFTLMILAAWFLSTRLASPIFWRPWRGWFYPTVLIAIVLTPVIHNFELVYPGIAWINRYFSHHGKDRLQVRRIDPTVKLRGWEELGDFVSRQQADLGGNAFVLCEDYQLASEMAFYVSKQPRTYCAGSYFSQKTKRETQYDMWPDRSLDPKDNPAMVGRNAVYVGYFRADLLNAFDSVEELPQLDIVRRGMHLRQFRVYRCRNFRGMQRPVDGKRTN